MKAFNRKYILEFKVPGGTSRGILNTKETWFLVLDNGISKGIGECGLFRGLSADDTPQYAAKLQWVCENIDLGQKKLLAKLKEYPSIQFGLEQAFISLNAQDPFTLFGSDFTKGIDTIAINGLIWMGAHSYMRQQIDQRLEQGFKCLKLKIGALAFEEEIKLLEAIRKVYSPEEIEIRVDANGAFEPKTALDKLKVLAELAIHSIEQPIKAGKREAMEQLCRLSPLPIALDEELIGIYDVTSKEELLQTIKPQYIILKPSLVGGFAGSQEWINLAEKYNIGWWITSALESNIGLNAIAQWTYKLQNSLPQGLGTGSLFLNNFESPLRVAKGKLKYDAKTQWRADLIDNLCI